MKLVKHLENKSGQSKNEQFKDDISTDKMFSVVECVPIPNQKVLRLKLEGGETLIIPGEILETPLNPGEKRIKSTDSEGNAKAEVGLYDDETAQIKNNNISVTINKNGKIEIKNLTSDDLTKLIHDLATNLQAAVTDLISATVPTSLGPQSLSVAIPWAIPVTGLLAKTVENTTKINLYKK